MRPLRTYTEAQRKAQHERVFGPAGYKRVWVAAKAVQPSSVVNHPTQGIHGLDDI